MIITGPHVSITNVFIEDRREKTKSLSMDKEAGTKQYSSTVNPDVYFTAQDYRREARGNTVTASHRCGSTSIKHPERQIDGVSKEGIAELSTWRGS